MKERIFLLLLLLSAACKPLPEGYAYYHNTLIPNPDVMGYNQMPPFLLEAGYRIDYPAEAAREAEFLREFVAFQSRIESGNSEVTAPIRLEITPSLASEAWEMEITEESLTLRGGTTAGLFYAIQSLRKILPIGNFSQVVIPSGNLAASPRFAYRGMHLDVSRHFFDLDFVKRYIDLLALHGINRLHWHLSDDQGWRIEIQKYPRLTEVGDARRETVIGRNSDQYDGILYGEGCLFTQEEAREVVAYAHERHIEVIPEIDMPGHMMAALAAYPELGCTGGPYEVWCRWGVSEEVLCAGNDQTLQFVCDVLDEIIEIFPSEWIHIGGDECPKVRWESCPKCQARIESLGLNRGTIDPEEALQGWFMRRVIEHLKQRGRTAIGWDEVLDGGIEGDDVVIMSWRGEQGALRAAEHHTRSIMAAQNYLYFDHYQTRDNSRERLALGGFNPIDRVYGFDPTAHIPDSLKHYVVGVQANLWAEYILSEEHAFHMALPRMAALSEIQWCHPAEKDYNLFLKRLQQQLALYTHLGYNYAPYILDIDYQVEGDTTSRSLVATLSTLDEAEIRYTLDGSKPNRRSPRYEGPITIDRTMTLQASALRGDTLSAPVPLEVRFSKATLCPIEFQTHPALHYTFKGASSLVDGLQGDKNYRTGRWIGFSGCDCVMTIDLGAPQQIQEVAFRCCVNKDDGCFDARGLEVEGSLDGEHFQPLHSVSYPALKEEDDHGIYPHHESFPASEARYLRLTIRHEASIPAWHPYYPGSPGFLFVDEVWVE